MSKRIVCVIALSAVLAACAASIVGAADIAATVNGEKITTDEVTKAMYEWYAPRGVNDVITMRLVNAEAKKAGVSVTEAEVDAKIKERQEELGTKGMDLEDMLLRQGVTINFVRALVRTELLAEKVVRKGISLTAKDFADYRKVSIIAVINQPMMMRQNQDQSKDQAGLEAETKAKVEKIAQELKDGLAFADAAKKYSDDGRSKASGGDQGWVKRDAGVFGAEFDGKAFSMKAGEISEPIKTSFGYLIIKLDAIGSEVTGDAKKQLEDTIIKSRINTSMWISDLRRQAKVESQFVPKEAAPTDAVPPGQDGKGESELPPPPPSSPVK